MEDVILKIKAPASVFIGKTVKFQFSYGSPVVKAKDVNQLFWFGG